MREDKMKRCKQCKKEQPTSCFHKNKSKKDGLNYICKLCAREKNKKYYENNKEKIIEQKKKYRENNKEKIIEQNKKYCEDNKEKITERKKKHYENMPAGIYVIKNTVNDKIYIGCSTRLPQRWRDHKRTLKKGTHGNRYLQKDFEKYGLGAFEFNVIKEYPKDTPFEVLEREETRIILENAKKKTSIYNISIKIRSYIS